MQNSIMVIHPYLEQGSTWVFDDEAKGLIKEPFVAGVPEVLELLLDNQKVEHPETGFKLLFSADPFPGYQLHATQHRTEAGGNWYAVEVEGNVMEGWLCPALLKYFSSAPADLYVRVETSK